MWRPSSRTVAVLLLLLVGVGVVAAATYSSTPVTNNTDGIYLQAGSGAGITVVGDTDVVTDSGGVDSETVRINTTDGGLNVSAAGAANGTITTANISGAWTNVTALNASQHRLVINPDDKSAMEAGGDIDTLAIAAGVSPDDGEADFVYAGDSGTSTVVVHGLTPNENYAAVESSTGDVLATDDANNDGLAVFSGLPNSRHVVYLQQSAGSAPALTDLSPSGDISYIPSKLTVDVDDADFPNDNVTVRMYWDGSLVRTKFDVQNAQTVEATALPAITAGEHNFTVIASDDYGYTVSRMTTVGIADTLYIRNESSPDDLVTETVTVTWHDQSGERIYRNQTSDGSINMTGLPATNFVVTANASANYTSRTAYIGDITQQQSVYLLPDNTSTIEARFILEDPTGKYSSQTRLYIKRGLNRSGVNRYRTIVSDVFGAEGVTATLEKGERYLLVIENADGEVQTIGPYRTDVSETVTVRPGTPSIRMPDPGESWSADATIDNDTIEYRYSDPTNATDVLTVVVHEKGDPSTLAGINRTYTSVGNVSGTYSLLANQTNKTWVVQYEIDRNGSSFNWQTAVANRPDLVPSLDREWRWIAGIGILLISAGAFSVLNAGVGAVIVALEGGVLWWTGWLEGATTGAAVVIALFITVLAHITKKSGP